MGVRVNGVAPGHTLLPNITTSTNTDLQALQSSSPLGIGPGADDVAAAVKYLLSAHSVTGQIIYTDSGIRFQYREFDYR